MPTFVLGTALTVNAVWIGLVAWQGVRLLETAVLFLVYG
jgi:hypothetical protein